MQRFFQDGLGHTIIHLEYFPIENYLHGSFIGMQTLPALMEAAEVMFRIFREKDCSKYLSDNTRMVGGKDFADTFIRHTFVPGAMESGLKCVAYVMPPHACNIQSIERLEMALPPELEFMLFDNVGDARYWLLCK